MSSSFAAFSASVGPGAMGKASVTSAHGPNALAADIVGGVDDEVIARLGEEQQ